MNDSYLVCLVVVLRVVFEDFRLLLVVKCPHEVFDTSTKVLSPFLAVEEPAVCKSHSKRSMKSSNIFLEAWTSNFRALKNRSYDH